MQKVYCIKKLWISNEGGDIPIPEFETEVFRSAKSRDKAWNRLVLDHNNMIQDAYEIDLNDDSYEEDYYYDWNNDMLIFYDKAEPTCHYDFFEKCEEVVIDEEE